MSITPTGRRVIIEPELKPEEEKSASGIILPAVRWSLHPDTIKGVVISIGPKCEDINIGQTILISRLCGVKLEINDKKLLMIDQEDIIAIVED